MTDVKNIIANTDAQVPSDNVAEKAALERSEANGTGFINIGGTFNGHYSKCQAKLFRSLSSIEGPYVGVDEQINKFFEENRGNLIVDVKYDFGSALVFYTKTLTEKETHVLARYAQALEAKVQEEMAAEEAEEAKRIEAEEARKQEERDLAEIGRRCRDNHAGVIEENRKLKKGK